MVELLFVVCMSAAPEQCQERALTFMNITPAQCLMGAQPELARWANSHPNETIKSWRCRAVNLAEKDA